MILREIHHPQELPSDQDLSIHNWISKWDTSYIGSWRTNEIPDNEKCTRDMIIFINQSRVNHDKDTLTTRQQNQITKIFEHIINWYFENQLEIWKFDDPDMAIINQRDRVITNILNEYQN